MTEEREKEEAPLMRCVETILGRDGQGVSSTKKEGEEREMECGQPCAWWFYRPLFATEAVVEVDEKH